MDRASRDLKFRKEASILFATKLINHWNNMIDLWSADSFYKEGKGKATLLQRGRGLETLSDRNKLCALKLLHYGVDISRRAQLFIKSIGDASDKMYRDLLNLGIDILPRTQLSDVRILVRTQEEVQNLFHATHRFAAAVIIGCPFASRDEE